MICVIGSRSNGSWRASAAVRLKTISPCPTLRSDRDKWGMGVRQALFPVPTFGTPRGVVSFPTLFSTASGVTGLVAGPSKASRPMDFE